MIANIPQGCIAVSDAFEAYFQKRFGHRPGNTLNDLATDEYQTASNEMLELFSGDQLEAFIWHEGGLKCLSKQGWNEFSAHHIFSSRTIESEWRPGCAWEGLRGATPFVAKAEFEALIAGLQRYSDSRGVADRKPDPQKYDPLALLEWSLPMAAAWIVWRDINEVRNYWNDYLAACGQDTLPYHVIDIEGCLGSDSGLGSDIGQGLKELRNAIDAGHLQARKAGETQPMTRQEWADAASNCKFDNVWIFRESVLDLWPAKMQTQELVDSVQRRGTLIVERKWLEQQADIYLGEVVAWWISRGVAIGTEEAEAQWDKAVVDVIDAIAKGEIVATGIPGGEYSEQVDPACCGRRFSKFRTVLIKPTDPDEDTSGLASGEIRIVRPGENTYRRSWEDVTISASKVLELWPELKPSPAAPGTTDEELVVVYPGAQSKLPGTVSAMKKTIHQADRFLNSQNYAPLTKTEAEEEILPQLHNGARSLIRKAITSINRRDKRRPARQLVNRSNELDECRQFLRSAT